VIFVIDYYNKGYDVVFVSARPDDYRKVTEDWLIENDLGFAFTLLMRRANDKRPDVDVKQEILDRYFSKEDIHQVIDDRPAVINMWLRNGLDVTDVGKGIDF
jgi:hypothetical protein